MDAVQYADFCESRQLSFCKYSSCHKYILYTKSKWLAGSDIRPEG